MSMTLLTLLWSGSSIAQDPKSLPTHTWMGVYMGQNKIGYMHLVVDRDKFEGRDVYRVDNEFLTKLKMLGTDVQQEVTTTLYTDDKFSPIFELFKMSSAGRTTAVEARFTPRSIECKLLSDGTETKKSVPIPEGVSLVGDSMYGLGTSNLKMGQSVKLSYFSPLTIAIEEMSMTAVRREQVDVKGKVYDTVVVKNKTPMGEMTNWQMDNGDLVKVEAIMGMVMLRETRDEALKGMLDDYTPPDDLAVLTSVKVDRDIPNPSRLREMKIKLIGIDDKALVKNDKRQSVSFDNKTKSATYAIKANSFQQSKSVKLPIKGDDYAALLSTAPYIQTDDPAIKEQAKKIVGKETSAYKAATRIRAWIKGNMVPRADSGVPRSAVDILNKPTGVCRDYAILYTALARAAGIPTRLVAGLVYMNGSFYYHAWAESFVGEWVPFDATLSTDFVDATHIKLTEGHATSMFEMAQIIGKLKAEVIEYK